MKINDERQQLIATIIELDNDIGGTKEKIKENSAAQKELVEAFPEYAEVEQLTEALAAAKQRLKQRCLGDHEYNNLSEAIGSMREKLRDDQDILSMHIVQFYAVTKERQVPVDETNGKDVIITGKLGKRQLYQESMAFDND